MRRQLRVGRSELERRIEHFRGPVARCYVAHAIVHVAYAEARAGRTGWLTAARKLPTIAAALLLGAFGGGLSAVVVATVLALASGVQVLWSIWDRVRTDPRTGKDPGPGLAGVRALAGPGHGVQNLSTR